MNTIEDYKKEIGRLNECLRIKNLQLDALYFVWCSGGCEKGVARYASEQVLTEEIVLSAERNTKRLRTYWENHKSRNKNGH